MLTIFVMPKYKKKESKLVKKITEINKKIKNYKVLYRKYLTLL